MFFNCQNCGKEKRGFPSGSNKFCSKKCDFDFRYLEYIERWKNGLETGTKGVKSIQTSNYIQRYIREKFDNKCSACGQGEIHNGKPLTLQLEHIDSDSINNKEENLSLLSSARIVIHKLKSMARRIKAMEEDQN